MESVDGIEETLNALLLNASELQEASEDRFISHQLAGEQKRLLDSLFDRWNQLNEKEKTELLKSKLENKVQALAKQNQACLKPVSAKR